MGHLLRFRHSSLWRGLLRASFRIGWWGVFGLAGAHALAQTPSTGPQVLPEAGRRAYTSYCARCHGLNLVVTGSAFFDLRTFPQGDKERFLRSVNKGLRAMPAWEGIVKPEDQELIWSYIAAVNGWDPSTETAAVKAAD
jgi:mono/diheme cytochrome c family protein